MRNMSRAKVRSLSASCRLPEDGRTDWAEVAEEERKLFRPFCSHCVKLGEAERGCASALAVDIGIVEFE